MSGFTARNKKDWEELEGLLAIAEKKLRRLSASDVIRLETLYRRVTVQLAQVATRTRDHSLHEYLNRLSSRAHAVIYLPPKQSMFAGMIDFISTGFARLIARHWRAHLISLALLLGGLLLGYIASMNNTVAAYSLLAPGETRTPGATREQLMETLRSGREQDGGEKFFFASFLFQHNFRVGLLAMALGIIAGVPTVFLMLYNGMMLGAFVAVHHMKGIDAEMWAWLLPHGVTELGAIVLCGGMGMVLGNCVIRPRGFSRLERLQVEGKDVARTGIGIGMMLVFAAIVESYVRQSYWSTDQRLAFATATFLFWVLYITWGRIAEKRSQNVPSA
ncbi:MAG: stage II sporulation protein M [Planctomycetaceae bacterium]|nr:stage II sporulation protein M [Planctomycetaceae bacterium]